MILALLALAVIYGVKEGLKDANNALRRSYEQRRDRFAKTYDTWARHRGVDPLRTAWSGRAIRRGLITGAVLGTGTVAAYVGGRGFIRGVRAGFRPGMAWANGKLRRPDYSVSAGALDDPVDEVLDAEIVDEPNPRTSGTRDAGGTESPEVVDGVILADVGGPYGAGLVRETADTVDEPEPLLDWERELLATVDDRPDPPVLGAYGGRYGAGLAREVAETLDALEDADRRPSRLHPDPDPQPIDPDEIVCPVCYWSRDSFGGRCDLCGGSGYTTARGPWTLTIASLSGRPLEESGASITRRNVYDIADLRERLELAAADLDLATEVLPASIPDVPASPEGQGNPNTKGSTMTEITRAGTDVVTRPSSATIVDPEAHTYTGHIGALTSLGNEAAAQREAAELTAQSARAARERAIADVAAIDHIMAGLTANDFGAVHVAHMAHIADLMAQQANAATVAEAAATRAQELAEAIAEACGSSRSAFERDHRNLDEAHLDAPNPARREGYAHH